MESDSLCIYNYLLAFLYSFHQNTQQVGLSIKTRHSIVSIVEVLSSEGEKNIVQRFKSHVLVINHLIKKYNHIEIF